MPIEAADAAAPPGIARAEPASSAAVKATGRVTCSKAHSGPMTRVIEPLYEPAAALESACERRITIRLAEAAGPLLHVCWVAELI